MGKVHSYKIGDKVEVVDDGGYIWEYGFGYTEVFGVITEIITGYIVKCLLYLKENGKPVSLARVMKPWAFTIIEIREVE